MKNKLIFLLWGGMLVVVTISLFFFFSKPSVSTTQTVTVIRKTLQQTVSGSGQVVSSKNVSINTHATGKVDQVYVHPGETVHKGDKIMDINLDQTAANNEENAWAAYLTAKNNLDKANADLHTLQSDEFVANQKFMNDAVTNNLSADDPTYIEENAQWLAAESAYKNQSSVIAQMQATANVAYNSYLETTSTVTAPADGVIKNIAYSTGMIIPVQSSSSTTTPSTQIGTIQTHGELTASLDISELDIANVTVGQSVSLTTTAIPNKTFSGKVISVATSGTTSSGVTNFAVTVVITNPSTSLLSGMSINGNIITQIKRNVLTLPNQAVQRVGTQSFVTVLKKGKQNTVPVKIGMQTSLDTEILSGVSEGETVVIPNMTSLGTTGNQMPMQKSFQQHVVSMH